MTTTTVPPASTAERATRLLDTPKNREMRLKCQQRLDKLLEEVLAASDYGSATITVEIDRGTIKRIQASRTDSTT